MNKLKVIVLSILAISVFTYIGAVIGYNIPRENVQAEQSKQAHIYTPEELVAEINKLRAKKGVPPLKIDERLNQSAYLAARDMQRYKYYEHENPVTKEKHTQYAINNTGQDCKLVSENINVVNSWVNPVTDSSGGWITSSTHNEAQLDEKYDNVGFASFVVDFKYKYDGKYSTSPQEVIYIVHFCDLR